MGVYKLVMKVMEKHPELFPPDYFTPEAYAQREADSRKHHDIRMAIRKLRKAGEHELAEELQSSLETELKARGPSITSLIKDLLSGDDDDVNPVNETEGQTSGKAEGMNTEEEADADEGVKVDEGETEGVNRMEEADADEGLKVDEGQTEGVNRKEDADEGLKVNEGVKAED